MISRILTIVVLVPLAILLVVFCVVNRAPVTLSMDAFGTMPTFAVEAPLFVVVLGAMILGVLIGGLAVFVAQARHRARAERREREVDSLRREVSATKAELTAVRRERERPAGAVVPVSSAPGLPAPRPA